MDKKEIFNFLNENSVAVIATTDGEKPYLRKVWTVKSNEDGILFHTGRMKEFYKQLVNNKHTEFCFTNKDNSIQIRVSGKACPIDDAEIKNEIVSNRPFLNDIAEKYGSFDFLAVFRQEECIASVWTRATNMQPKKIVELY